MKKVLLILILFVVGCYRAPEPQTVSELWFRRCEYLIDALSRFYAENEVYPGTLEDLEPRYLKKNPIPVNERSVVSYSRLKDTGSYQLSFEISDPEYKNCRYLPELGWRCFGAE